MAKILWTQRQDMGPSARVSHGMAYDAARQRVVLFGGVVQVGSDKFQPVADTWQWNGEFWTQVEDIGPSARGSHAMAYDASREQVILFGGNTSPNPIGEIASGDTWAWDGEGWTQVADTGPSKRMVTMTDCLGFCSWLFGTIFLRMGRACGGLNRTA
jgi:hypothetical protein